MDAQLDLIEFTEVEDVSYVFFHCGFQDCTCINSVSSYVKSNIKLITLYNRKGMKEVGFKI